MRHIVLFQMKLKDVFEKSIQFFKERNIENSRLEAELLISHVLKTDRVGIYLKYEAPLSDSEIKVLRDLVMRRSKGEPSAYLTGEKYFFNRPFSVGPGALIPRPETELLVEDAIKSFQLRAESDKSDISDLKLKIVDLGSGTGCIGISLGKHFAQSEIYLIEKSPEAYRYLEKNIQQLISSDKQYLYNAILSSVEDWSSPHLFDLIVANPPYISLDDKAIDPMVKKYEPPEALFAQNNGLSCITSWLNFAIKYLAPGGYCYFEIGYNQGEEVFDLFTKKGVFEKIEVLKDFSHKDRIIKAIKK